MHKVRGKTLVALKWFAPRKKGDPVPWHPQEAHMEKLKSLGLVRRAVMSPFEYEWRLTPKGREFLQDILTLEALAKAED